MLRKICFFILVSVIVVVPAEASRGTRAGSSVKPGRVHVRHALSKARRYSRRSTFKRRLTIRDVSPETSWICEEASTGLVLSEHAADQPRPPASMIKMLEFLMVSQGLKEGKWTLKTPITVSRHAAGVGGSEVYLKAGEVWPLEHLMEAEAVVSANDAAMAVAEGLWGSAAKFKKARDVLVRKFGMTHSDLHSVHGLPPGPGQKPDVTTARDMIIVARHCVRDPQIMKWVGIKEIRFKPDQAIRYSTNKLLWRMPGCDGLKTGYTRAAGFCVTATAKRHGIRLIAVVMGCKGKYERFDEAQEILDECFPKVTRVKVIARGEALKTPVSVLNCPERETLLTAADDLWVVVRTKDAHRIQVAPEFSGPLRAPLTSGTVVGEVSAELGGKKLASVPVAVDQDLPEAGWRWKLLQAVKVH